MEHAIEEGGYETYNLWGVQGSAKSNRTLQIGFWAYQDWDKVLNNIVFMPDSTEIPSFEKYGFIQKMKSITKGKRIPFLGWDDLTVHMASSSWRTNIEQYEAIDNLWAAIRTKVSVMVANNPLIDRIPKNIKDNITMEHFIGRNQAELIERYVRLPGLKQVESNFFKIQVEPLKRFNIYDVPTDVFKQYWNLRLELADHALAKMGKAFDSSNLDGLVQVSQLVKDLDIAPTTVSELVSKGVVRGERVNKRLYIDKEDYENVLVPYYEKKVAEKQKRRQATQQDETQ